MGSLIYGSDGGFPAVDRLAASNGTLVFSCREPAHRLPTPAATTDAPSNRLCHGRGPGDLNESEAADVGIWSGLPSAYTYQWERCDAAGANCADIYGATGPTYVPTPETTARRSGSGSRRPTRSARRIRSSRSLRPCSAWRPRRLRSRPRRSSTARRRSASSSPRRTGAWTNSATSYAYQWQRCDDTGANCVDIAGATSSQYTPVADDVGYEIRSEVLASNAVGPASDGYALSPTTDVVTRSGRPRFPSRWPTRRPRPDDPTHDGSIADAGLTPPLTQAWSVTLPARRGLP